MKNPASSSKGYLRDTSRVFGILKSFGVAALCLISVSCDKEPQERSQESQPSRADNDDRRIADETKAAANEERTNTLGAFTAGGVYAGEGMDKPTFNELQGMADKAFEESKTNHPNLDKGNFEAAYCIEFARGYNYEYQKSRAPAF